MMKYDEIKYLRSFIALSVLIVMKFFKQLRPKQLQLRRCFIANYGTEKASSYPYGQYKMQHFAQVLVEPKLNILNVSVSARPNNMYVMTSRTSQAHGFKMT